MLKNNNIQKLVTGQGTDCTTDCLLDQNYFNKYYGIKVIDLSQQQTLVFDPKAVQEISFTGNLAWQRLADRTMFFITEESKETILDFFTKNCESIVNLYCINIISI